MTEATIAEATETSGAAVNLPPGPRLPMFIQGLAYAVSRTWTVEQMVRRYGDVFTMTLPVFGRAVVVADPQLAKQLFMANTDDVGN
ncbi:MAG: cytochrome family, partial [Mycobacterium sp.]|nr:cytochrome family [Mycobacterium sp.]